MCGAARTSLRPPGSATGLGASSDGDNGTEPLAPRSGHPGVSPPPRTSLQLMDRADGALEILDRPVALADRVASPADIDRPNAGFAGSGPTLRETRPAVAATPGGDALVPGAVGGG